MLGTGEKVGEGGEEETEETEEMETDRNYEPSVSSRNAVSIKQNHVAKHSQSLP